MKNQKVIISSLLVFVIFIFSQRFYIRTDFTADQKYSLSEATKEIVSKIKKPISITVFLHGDFPATFKKLETETHYILDEIQLENTEIIYEFIDPFEDNQLERLKQLYLEPSTLNIEDNGEFKQKQIFPWAIVQQADRIERVELLQSNPEFTAEDQVNASIEHLEYGFTNALEQVTMVEKPKVGIITHHFEVSPQHFSSFMQAASKFAKIEPYVPFDTITLSKKDIKSLAKYDALVVAKPNIPFTEKDKLVLDQYIMSGGKTLWMLDQMNAEMDSLFRTGSNITLNRDLNLTDLLFSYGVRVNPVLVKDLKAAQIKLATGKVGNNTQYANFDWPYYPKINPNQNHPIGKNNAPVRMVFGNQIDTLRVKGIKHIPLLSSSVLSKTQAALTKINLESVQNINESEYVKGPQLMGVLSEGTFQSAYKNRVKEFEISNFKPTSDFNKMIVIADGDFASNEFHNGRPFPIGYDKWIGFQYGNGDFIKNSLKYLLDDKNVSKLRAKKYALRMLDFKKTIQNKRLYQLLNIGLPLLFISLLGFVFHWYRKKKYA